MSAQSQRLTRSVHLSIHQRTTWKITDIDGTPIPSMTDIEFTSLHITSHQVEKLSQNLKMVTKEIAPVLAFIFQQSYDTSQVPSNWQLANITAIFKKGDKTNLANYRPVSLTCILCKTTDHIVFNQFMSHLDDKKILRNFQHGFRRNHSLWDPVTEYSRGTIKEAWYEIDHRSADTWFQQGVWYRAPQKTTSQDPKLWSRRPDK